MQLTVLGIGREEWEIYFIKRILRSLKNEVDFKRTSTEALGVEKNRFNCGLMCTSHQPVRN